MNSMITQVTIVKRLARFARALHPALTKGGRDPAFSLREKVPRRGG